MIGITHTETDVRSTMIADSNRKTREEIFGLETETETGPEPKQAAASKPTYTSPLHRYSLRGQGNRLVEEAVAKLPLLGDVCMTGDVTLWGARRTRERRCSPSACWRTR